MSKTICTLCKNGKANRPCPLENGASVCSRCCAEKRSVQCAECRYYVEAENYAIERYQSTGKHRFTLNLRYEDEFDEIFELAENKHFRECTKRLDKLSLLIPDSHLLHYTLGMLAGIQEDHKKALLHFNRCLAIFPYDVDAWFDKGIAHQKLFDISDMIQAWRMAKRLTKPENKVHQLVTQYLSECEQGIMEGNHQTLDEFIECEKIFQVAFDQLHSGNPESALTGFAKVLKSNPNHVQSCGNIGLCHAMSGRKEEAVSALQKALELDPNYLPAKQNLLIVLALKPGEFISKTQLSEPIEYYKDKFSLSQAEENNITKRD